jgi:hypothetical protein
MSTPTRGGIYPQHNCPEVKEKKMEKTPPERNATAKHYVMFDPK